MTAPTESGHPAPAAATPSNSPATPVRMTADVDGDIVVFLIGMRVSVRHIGRAIHLFRAMPRMIEELSADPDSGFLGGHSWFGSPTIMVQYWRSFEDLDRYARDAEREHRPAWAAFNRTLRAGADVGVWHETYRVRAGEMEAVYVNMPPFGLARATRAVPATGRRSSAAGRMASGSPAPGRIA
jgi:hypothetical protein